MTQRTIGGGSRRLVIIGLGVGLAAGPALPTPLGGQVAAPGPAPDPHTRDHRPAPVLLAGEFAFRTKMKPAYLSAGTGELSTAPAIGPNEKFRITVVSPQYRMMQTARGAYLELTGSQYPGDGRPLRLVASAGDAPPRGEDPRLLAIEEDASRQDRHYLPLHKITPKTFPTWHLEDARDNNRAGHPFVFTNPAANMATHEFWLLKCGDVGSGEAYALKLRDSGFYLVPPLSPSYEKRVFADVGPGTFRLIRQADGSYALWVPGIRRYVTASGGGGYASAHDTPDGATLPADRTQVQGWEKFRIAERGSCVYTIQTAKGWFVGLGTNGISTRISDPGAAPSIGYNAEFELIPWAWGH